MAASLVIRLTGGNTNNNGLNSLGGVMSANEPSNSSMTNLFPNVTPAEANNGCNHYSMIDIFNSGDANAYNVDLFMDTPTSSNASEIYFGTDANNTIHNAAWNGEVLNNCYAAPASPSMNFTYNNAGSPKRLPTIEANNAVRVCLRWTTNNNAPSTTQDLGTIGVQWTPSA